MKKKKLPRFRIKEKTTIFGDTEIWSRFYPQELYMLFWIFPVYVTMSDRDDDVYRLTIEEAREYIDKYLEQERNNKIIKEVKRYRPYK